MAGAPRNAPSPDAPIAGGKSWGLTRFVAKFVAYVVVLLLLLVGAAALLGFIVYDHVVGPGNEGPPHTLTVPRGLSGRDIGALLAREELIEHAGFFRLALKIDGTEKPIKSGAYDLPKGLSALELLRLLQGGPKRQIAENQVKVTVPEGLTIQQASLLFPDPAAYIEAASDLDLVLKLGIDAKTLEGFLMPDTYFFDEQPSEREVVERMLSQFQQQYARLLEGTPATPGMGMLEVVTLASLVEEEAKVEEERPIVAAVMLNRLKKKMPLQMDSTLQFVLGKYGQRLLDTDKAVDSPYNTYVNAGLPPGPISSPGVSSLRAAMRPASVEYLYFVSNADGKTHTFSKTLSEHEKAVARYRGAIAGQRRELRNQAPPAATQ